MSDLVLYEYIDEDGNDNSLIMSVSLCTNVEVVRMRADCDSDEHAQEVINKMCAAVEAAIGPDYECSRKFSDWNGGRHTNANTAKYRLGYGLCDIRAHQISDGADPVPMARHAAPIWLITLAGAIAKSVADVIEDTLAPWIDREPLYEEEE